jgi:hypothetical protein
MSPILPRDRLMLQTAWYHCADRLLVRTAILGVILILIVRVSEYLGYAARAITFPFELDYGEGIVWQQALLIPGSQMYGDITQFPFIVFHYTPVYHLVVRAIASLGVDWLAAGRGVTVAATVAIAVLAGAVVSAAMQKTVSPAGRIAGATVGGLMVLTYRPLQAWAVMMRVDMLAIGFSIAGVYLAILAGQRTIILCAAFLMFVLAVYTKQSELAAPIAVMLVATVVSARSALKASAFALLIGGVPFIILQLSTGGGFWHHIFEYNINRFFYQRLIEEILRQKPDALGVLVGVLAFAFLWWTEAAAILPRNINGLVDALRQSQRLRALMVVSLWFGFASAQLVSLGKWGAGSNYFIEWMCISAVPTGMVASLAWDRAATRSKAPRFAGLVGILLSLALAEHAHHRPLVEFLSVDDPNEIALRSHLVNLIRENPKPSLSEDMVLLLRAGQPVPIEPAIFADLTATGIWDQRPFLKLIEDHTFGLIILKYPEGQDEGEGRFTSEMANAIQNNYPMIEHLGNYIVRRPVES